MQGTDLLMLKAMPCVFVGLGGVSKCMLAFSDNNALFHHEVQNWYMKENQLLLQKRVLLMKKLVGIGSFSFLVLCATLVGFFFIQDAFVCTTKFSEIMD